MVQRTVIYNPNDDGITHINVYSQGKTLAGRFLSNFAYSPISTTDGEFDSIEGYWYWLKTCNDRLRNLSGIHAKRFGKSLPQVFSIDEAKIKKALKIKIDSYYEILNDDPLWSNISIPLTHYYVYDNKPKEAGGQWVIDYLEQIRYDKVQ